MVVMKQFDVKFPLSPLHLFVIIVAIVYLTEVLEMFIMGEDSDNILYLAILDASILTVLSAPILWWLIIKQTSGALDEIKENEERFRSVIKSAIDAVILVDGNGNIIIEGTVEGSVKTNNFLYVGDKAKILAKVEAKDARIGGEVRGNLKIDGYLEIKNGAKIFGDVEVNKISIEKGAILNGNCIMNKAQSENK